jgi:hypothetical protein
MVLQPLNAMRVAPSAQDRESRFIIGSHRVHATSKHYQCRCSALPNRFAFHFNVDEAKEQNGQR